MPRASRTLSRLKPIKPILMGKSNKLLPLPVTTIRGQLRKNLLSLTIVIFATLIIAFAQTFFHFLYYLLCTSSVILKTKVGLINGVKDVSCYFQGHKFSLSRFLHRRPLISSPFRHFANMFISLHNFSTRAANLLLHTRLAFVLEFSFPIS